MKHDTQTNAKGKQVLEQIRHIGPFLPATLTITKKKCGNPNCRCAKQGPKHETALLTWKKDGVTRTLHVPHELRDQVAAWTAEWRKLKSLIEKAGNAQRQYFKTRRVSIRKSSRRS